MSTIVILGGSIAGLLSGMQLARAGHSVTVLERESRADVAPSAGAPIAPRAGAPQAVHGHALLARVAFELRSSLPEVYPALVAAGVGELKLVSAMPASITDRSSRPGDDDLVMLQTRRHTLDRVLVELATQTPGLELRFDTAATGLEFAREAQSPPRINGVQIAGGEILAAEMVIDASGRRTQVPGWLEKIGIDLPLEAWDCGLVYYTRHYRVRAGVTRPPLNRIFGAGGNVASLRISWFPGDNDTAMLAQTVLAEDRLLKSVRRVECFEAVTRTVPTIAAWCDCADPITDVFSMGALQNTLRRVVRDGEPLVLGLHLVGDSACTTNPVLGRGISFAAISSSGAASAIAAEPDDPVAQALKLDDVVTREIEPGFRENALNDRALVQRFRADLAGEPSPEPPAPPDGEIRADELLIAGMQDADLFRAAMRYAHMLASGDILKDPAIVDRVRQIVPPGTQAPSIAGPTRQELVRLLDTP